MEEVQDQAAYLEHLQSILLEFDANNAPREGQLNRTFYDGLRPSIKLWIADIGEDIPWDDLIRAANKAKAKSKIQGSIHLDQWCPKGKRPLKISLNFRNDLAEKEKATFLQVKASLPAFDQSEAPKKIRKEKKKTWQQKERTKKDPKEGSPAPAALGNNTVQATGSQKKKARDASEVTCYSCTKKGHYASDCSEPKAKNNCSLCDLHVGDCKFRG